MEKILKAYKDFITKSAELLKEEKIEDLVKHFELGNSNLEDLQKSIEDEKADQIKKADEKEKQDLKKYADLFVSASTFSELLNDVKQAETLIKSLQEEKEEIEKRLEVVEKSTDWSKQPNPIEKQAESSMASLGNALLGR